MLAAATVHTVAKLASAVGGLRTSPAAAIAPAPASTTSASPATTSAESTTAVTPAPTTSAAREDASVPTRATAPTGTGKTTGTVLPASWPAIKTRTAEPAAGPAGAAEAEALRSAHALAVALLSLHAAAQTAADGERFIGSGAHVRTAERSRSNFAVSGRRGPVWHEA